MNLLEVARAALREANRPDLADGIFESFGGYPGHRYLSPRIDDEDTRLLLKALSVAHEANGQEVELLENGDGTPAIDWNPW